jgi:drug/metabolite transporter (DMT)-like permease
VVACLAWGIDNNFTRKVSLTDATWIASVKGLVAGVVNLVLAFSLGASLPPAPNILGAMSVGILAYGVSLALFVVGLRHLGMVHTGAYFSVAPFFGVLLAVLIGNPITLSANSQLRHLSTCIKCIDQIIGVLQPH